MRAATREVSLLARCATASMSTAVAGPSRSSTARHFSFLSTQSSGAGFSGRRFEPSAPGSQPLSCGCCGRKPVSFPATSQLRVASYSTRAPSGGRALMTSAAEQAPARSSPASAPATEASASHSSYQPPDLAITNPINSPKGGPSRGPFRGADLKDPSTASRQDSIELEDTLPSTLPQEQTGACSTLSPSSPSAPRSQRSSAESSAATAAQESASASAAAPPIASTPKRGGGAAFRPKKAALTLSPEAISRLRGLSEAPGGPKLIRIGVRNKGCAGMSYHLEYVTPEQAGKFDEKVQQDGVTVLIESKALFSIIGSEMDWQDDRLSSKFIFNNPNVKEACGCGESFLT